MCVYDLANDKFIFKARISKENSHERLLISVARCLTENFVINYNLSKVFILYFYTLFLNLVFCEHCAPRNYLYIYCAHAHIHIHIHTSCLNRSMFDGRISSAFLRDNFVAKKSFFEKRNASSYWNASLRIIYTLQSY